MSKYKHGKQEYIMPKAVFQAATQDAVNAGTSLNHLAYCVGLWHTGVRKSELYERLLSDVTITKDFVIVDFHQRKKGGAEVPPLKIPREFYGIEDFLIPWVETRQKARPPRRYTKKRLFHHAKTGEYRQTEPSRGFPNGQRVTVKKLVSEKRRDIWLFPNIGSVTAWKIVKDILGDQYYPHYMRLRKLSAIGENPETATIIHLKSVSGIKSLRALEAYLGVSKKAQDKAMQVE